MDVPYLIHVPDGDELWLVDGEQRLLITPRIYDLLVSNGADLPPAYGIEGLREQNAKLRELVTELHSLATYEYVYVEYENESWERRLDAAEDGMRELGIEVVEQWY